MTRVVSRQPSSGDHLIEFAAGDFVFEEGDLGTEMFLIHEGQVEILYRETGTRLAMLEKGDFFGEMSLLDARPRSASARAVTDAKLVVVTAERLDRILRTEPEIAVRIMRMLARRLRETDNLLKASLGREEPAQPGVEAASAVQPRGRLIHVATGSVFRLGESSSSSIGRIDPVTGIRPDVDLTLIDPERSSSRQHAKIVFDEDQFLLAEEIATTNGTYVNDERVKPGSPRPLADGDRVRFGLVDLEFHLE